MSLCHDLHASYHDGLHIIMYFYTFISLAEIINTVALVLVCTYSNYSTII
jgi:hypothetical protein